MRRTQFLSLSQSSGVAVGVSSADHKPQTFTRKTDCLRLWMDENTDYKPCKPYSGQSGTRGWFREACFGNKLFHWWVTVQEAEKEEKSVNPELEVYLVGHGTPS